MEYDPITNASHAPALQGRNPAYSPISSPAVSQVRQQQRAGLGGFGGGQANLQPPGIAGAPNQGALSSGPGSPGGLAGPPGGAFSGGPGSEAPVTAQALLDIEREPGTGLGLTAGEGAFGTPAVGTIGRPGFAAGGASTNPFGRMGGGPFAGGGAFSNSRASVR